MGQWWYLPGIEGGGSGWGGYCVIPGGIEGPIGENPSEILSAPPNLPPASATWYNVTIHHGELSPDTSEGMGGGGAVRV